MASWAWPASFAGSRLAALVAGDVLLPYGNHTHRRRADQCDDEYADNSTTSPSVSLAVTIDPLPARCEKLTLVVRQGERGSRRPCFQELQASAAEQEAVVAVGVQPITGGQLDLLPRQQILPRLVDPVRQAGPLLQQRLVGDLDGGCTARWVAVERDETMPAVLDEHTFEVVGGDARLLELRTANPPARVFAILVDGHQSEEHGPRRLASRVVEGDIDLLRLAPDRSGQASGAYVVLQRDAVGLPTLEQFGQKVLHERKRPRLELGVLGDLFDDGALDRDAHSFRRSPHRVSQLVGCHCSERDRPPVDRLSESGMSQWPIEVVSPQRDDHANARIRHVGQLDDHLQEGSPIVIAHRLREQFLELIDDHEQLGVGWDVSADRLVERASAPRQLAHHVEHCSRGHACESGRQLLEG